MGLLGLNEVDLGRFRWQPATKPSFKQESNLKTEILTNTQNYATILENYPRKINFQLFPSDYMQSSLGGGSALQQVIDR